MRIKKHINKNDYLLTENGLWIRNFTKPFGSPVDINILSSPLDHELFLNNELNNLRKRYMEVHTQDLSYSNIIIVSDGHDFNIKHKILAHIPTNVVIIAVNGSLAKWELIGKKSDPRMQRHISCYVTNNPYQECLRYLPSEYFPQCIASSRTHPSFLDSYRGPKALYIPAPSEQYAGPMNNPRYFVDDYRNSVCAAIGLSYRFKVRKLALLCCDASFKDKRPASISLDNGLQCYQQQIASQQIVDGNLYWLKSQGIEVYDCSSGIRYNNATYISEKELIDLFREDKETT